MTRRDDAIAGWVSSDVRVSFIHAYKSRATVCLYRAAAAATGLPAMVSSTHSGGTRRRHASGGAVG